VSRKGGRRDALAINPQTAARLRAYLDASGHGADVDGPLFRPLKHNGKRQDERRGMDPDAIDRVVRKFATELGLDRGYSAHSMRATFINTVLENGAQLEDVQKTAGHRDPGTTKLYDRRGYNPEKAASFFATYWQAAPLDILRNSFGLFASSLVISIILQMMHNKLQSPPNRQVALLGLIAVPTVIGSLYVTITSPG
jgi:Phage integrase family